MNKKDFRKIKLHDRVTVTGKQDDKQFTNAPGVVIERSNDHIGVLFDAWSEGHGKGERQWNFFYSDAKDFTITKVEPPKHAPAPLLPVKKKFPKGPQAYKGNGRHAWEKVTDDTQRLRVPGGWLYSYETSSAHGITFVATPEVTGYPI